MREIQFLKPIKIREMGKRYFNYPGVFAIGKIDLNKIFPGISSVKTKKYHSYTKGELDSSNLIIVNKIVKYLEPQIIVEIGTYRGRTTYNMAKNSIKSKIITIDIADIETNIFSGVDMKYHLSKDEVGTLYKGSEVEDRITQIYSDSLSIECQLQLDQQLGNNKIDFAFIDGGHDYDSVRHNFEELILPRLNIGGVVIFDDYIRPHSIVGVTHYLLEKAYVDRYVFYWYAPNGKSITNEVIFLNILETRNYNWRKTTG